jgi:signal transduction histidine kinase
MTWWVVAAVANAVVFVAYLAISRHIAMGIIRSKQWFSNPLAVATAAIFFTCAVHHGSHALHMLLPRFGIENTEGLAMRTAFDSWHGGGWDVLTAAVGVWYWTLRGRFPALVRGSAIFEDLRERQRQALDIHDNVVQGLATAKLALELDQIDEAQSAIDHTLEAARGIITNLLGAAGSGIELKAGDLRRRAAAPSSDGT